MWSAQVWIAKPNENVVEELELVLSRDEWRWQLTVFAEQFSNPTPGAVARSRQADQATDDLAIKVDVVAARSKLEEAVGHDGRGSGRLRKPRLPDMVRAAGGARKDATRPRCHGRL